MEAPPANEKAHSLQSLIREFKMARLTKEGEKRVAYCDANNLCRFCLEPAKAGVKLIRKNHPYCLRKAHRLVAAGDKTKRELIAEGYMAESATAGRKRGMPAKLTGKTRTT